MSEFSDRPLVAGSLIGLRSFGVDHLGRLHGPSYTQVFRPGENVAVCRSEASEWNIFYRPLSFSLTTGGRMVPNPEPEPKSEEKPQHAAGNIDCTCGFYAYFDGRNDYKEPGRLAVLIEGYGVCTVGSRGFRAEKARAVAFIAPGKKFPSERLRLVLRNYPDVPDYATKAEALEAHPLTVPDVPGPDSPGFWERPIR